MMWVRFPSGQCVQYNRATYARRFEHYTDLYASKGADGSGSDWIAQVPNTCLIEVEFACRVYNPLDKSGEPEVAKELRSMRRKLSRALPAQPKLRVVR